jgi:hypothetical protein
MTILCAWSSRNNCWAHTDARCRFCGYLNMHGPDGHLLNDAEINIMQFPTSTTIMDATREGISQYMSAGMCKSFMSALLGMPRILAQFLRAPWTLADLLVSSVVDDISPQFEATFRRETDQRCEECGYGRAYYRTAQVNA